MSMHELSTQCMMWMIQKQVFLAVPHVLFFFAEKVPGVGLSSNVTVRLFLVRGAPLAKSHSWALPVK